MSSISSINERDLDFSTCFSIFKEVKSFKEKEAFNSLKELDFLSYYKDFELLLCEQCLCPIFPSFKAFKSHLIKDLSLIPSKETKDLMSKALFIFNILEVSSYKRNIELIFLFQKHFSLKAFKGLKVLDLYSCDFPSCSIVLSNLRNIRRHF